MRQLCVRLAWDYCTPQDLHYVLGYAAELRAEALRRVQLLAVGSGRAQHIAALAPLHDTTQASATALHAVQWFLAARAA